MLMSSTVRSRFPEELAVEIGQPQLPELVRRFLHEQLDPNGPPADTILLDACPVFRGRLAVHHHAKAIFYAPSDPAGTGGMHGEMIRSNPSWRGQYTRHDTVLIRHDNADDGMHGMTVARVMLFCSFKHEGIRFPRALVEWFTLSSGEPDPITGMWIVEPHMVGEQRSVGLVHLNCLVRGCQLIGVYGDDLVPDDFQFFFTLDSFRRFYVNMFLDYHSHEIL
jgi:hypothetical protein